jgi:deoxyribodipyrimidine photo-lyase
LEECVVRRELSDNFCLRCPDYDRFEGLPDWGRRTLEAHAGDRRGYVYGKKEFAAGRTHSALWNAAQAELRERGRLHGYMRMYWAKKILEWSATPREAVETAIWLNDRYALDGRDPNGYVGVLWCVGGLHDRPWSERPVYGQVRYMNERGCRRKFDVDAYVAARKALMSGEVR